MATIKLKRSDVSGKTPLPEDLELGELALNTSDSNIFMKNTSGNIVNVVKDAIQPVLNSRATISHVRGKSGFENIIFDRIVITGGLNSLKMVTGEDIQEDGSIIPRVAKDSAKRDGTRVVVNGSAFYPKGDGFYLPAGLYIHDGVPYQEFSPTEERAQEAIVMYRDGVLRPARLSDGKTAAQYVADGAIWSTGWGNLLVVDGTKQSLPSTNFNNQISARTILGQRANGDYVVILVEGKSNEYGVTVFQAQDICLSEGLVLAMNLDGGGTTQCWWDTAYAHPSSDDTPRRVGNYLTASVLEINSFDTGNIDLEPASGVAPFYATGLTVRQVNNQITLGIGADVPIPADTFTPLTSKLSSRFWPDNGTLVRGNLGGAGYAPITLGMPHPLTGEIFVRAPAVNVACSGTVVYGAKWSG